MQTVLSHVLTQNHKQLLETLFHEADTHGNGVLNKDELKTLLNNHHDDFGLSRKEIRMLFTQADVNQDGEVDYSKFIPACVELICIIQAKNAAHQLRIEREGTAKQEADYYLRGKSAPEMENMMRLAFEATDQDGNGTLDPVCVCL